VHMPELSLYETFRGGILERVPAPSPPPRRTLPLVHLPAG